MAATLTPGDIINPDKCPAVISSVSLKLVSEGLSSSVISTGSNTQYVAALDSIGVSATMAIIYKIMLIQLENKSIVEDVIDSWLTERLNVELNNAPEVTLNTKIQRLSCI